jgi:hypothetical protein
MLQALVAKLGTPDVHFLGHVSNEELTALYDVADVFLCASEHEGFCVPLIEAFHKGVPVVAYRSTAIPATMDGGGILHDSKDPIYVASLLDALTSDARIEDAVVQSQDAALQRLLGKDFGGTLLRYVADTLGLPPRQAPEVAWDFWQQFDQFERFEELRQFRPALYRALPIRPGAGAPRSESDARPSANPAVRGNGQDPGVADAEPRIQSPQPRISDPGRR